MTVPSGICQLLASSPSEGVCEHTCVPVYAGEEQVLWRLRAPSVSEGATGKPERDFHQEL